MTRFFYAALLTLPFFSGASTAFLAGGRGSDSSLPKRAEDFLK
jgi:hypothetical protein